jgi:hypothetical protein
METTVKVDFHEIGSDTGQVYEGQFVIKTLLSRRDLFMADERRRLVIGSLGESAPSMINGEAYMIGQLAVRIVDAPKWFKESDLGLELKDENIIPMLFKLCMDKEQERKDEIKKKSEESLKKLSKKIEKA